MPKKVNLDLCGLDGNIFFLMGAFQRQAKKEGWTPNEIDTVLKDCRSGDYDHALQVLIANTQSSDEEDDCTSGCR